MSLASDSGQMRRRGIGKGHDLDDAEIPPRRKEDSRTPRTRHRGFVGEPLLFIATTPPSGDRTGTEHRVGISDRPEAKAPGPTSGFLATHDDQGGLVLRPGFEIRWGGLGARCGDANFSVSPSSSEIPNWSFPWSCPLPILNRSAAASWDRA